MRIKLDRVVFVLGICCLAGLAVSVVFAQQGRVKAVHQTVVVDSRGRTIGTSLGGATIHVSEVENTGDNEVRPIVLLEIDGQLVAVNVARDRFFASGFLDFDGLNCTGNAWFPTPAAVGTQ